MPVSVRCPHCSEKVRLNDALAGQITPCPACGQKFQLPAATRPVPAKPVARPVAASPRSADDEEDDYPRKRRTVDDEVEDEGYRPRSRRRSRDDEDGRPRKKKSALPLVFGILAGLFLLCGGGAAGVYFGLVKPAAEKVRAANDRLAREIQDAQQREAAGRQGQPGQPAVPAGTPVATLTPDEVSEKATQYNGQWVTVKGRVRIGMEVSLDWGNIALEKWGNGKQLMFIALNGRQRPQTVLFSHGDEVEILCQVADAGDRSRYVTLNNAQLMKRTPAANVISTPNRPGPAEEKPLEITAADLLAEYVKDEKAAEKKYYDKALKVTGEVKWVGISGFQLIGMTDKRFSYQVTVQFPFERPVGQPDLKPGDKTTATGKVGTLTTFTDTKVKSLDLRYSRIEK